MYRIAYYFVTYQEANVPEQSWGSFACNMALHKVVNSSEIRA